MAENVITSNINNITEYPNSFKRQGAFPLERFSLFNSLSDAETYASSNPVAYVGQPIVVATNPEWTFSDEGEHTLIWDAGAWSFDQSDTGNEDYFATSITINSGESNEVTAIRATAPSVTAYVIGADGTLIEMGTKAEIDDASGDASSAIAALDLVSTAVATVNNDVVTINAVKQTDGQLAVDTSTAATKVTLAKVAKTGKATDVAIDDTNSKFTATNVEDALEELHDNLAITVDEVNTGLASGILKAYKIYSGGVQTAGVTTGGTLLSTINIPKDFLVKSATLETVAEADEPYEGAVVGDKYLDFVLNTKDSAQGSETAQHVYVPVNDLFDSYTSDDTSSTPILITVNNSTNKISATCNISGTADIASVSNGVVTIKAGLTQSGGAVSNNSSSDITLAKVATTGSGDDVVYTTGNDGESVNDALTRLDGDDTTTGSVSKKIKDAVDALDSSVSATAADGNKYSVLTGVTEADGKLTSKTEVKLEAVAKTGAAADVSIADSGSVITATTVEGALQEIASEIDGMDLASTAIATVSNNVVTINPIKEVDGKVTVDNTAANQVTLEEVAYTGAAADVSVAAHAGSGLESGTVQGTLQSLASSISNNAIDIQTGSTDGTIKWKKGSDSSYTEVTPKNLKTIATTGAAADVSIADSDSVITATTVEGALSEIAKEIDAMDADLDASSTGLSAGTTVDTVAVVSGVTEVDGKITSVDSVLVDKAGSAATVLGSSSTDNRDSNTVHGVKKLASAKSEYLGTATSLTTNSATITVNSSQVTASSGDFCTYSGSEYFWNGSSWSRLGIKGAVDANNNSLTINSNGNIVLNNLILDGGSASTVIS